MAYLPAPPPLFILKQSPCVPAAAGRRERRIYQAFRDCSVLGDHFTFHNLDNLDLTVSWEVKVLFIARII